METKDLNLQTGNKKNKKSESNAGKVAAATGAGVVMGGGGAAAASLIDKPEDTAVEEQATAVNAETQAAQVQHHTTQHQEPHVEAEQSEELPGDIENIEVESDTDDIGDILWEPIEVFGPDEPEEHEEEPQDMQEITEVPSEEPLEIDPIEEINVDDPNILSLVDIDPDEVFNYINPEDITIDVDIYGGPDGWEETDLDLYDPEDDDFLAIE